MSTREMIYHDIEIFSDEQIEELADFIKKMKTRYVAETDEIENLCGIFHDAANPDLRVLENKAWEQAAIENEMNFWKDYNDENL